MNTATVTEAAESKKAVFRRALEMYATGNLSSLDDVMAPDYVGHVSTGDRDLEGLRQSILHFHNLFVYTADSFEVRDQFVEGDMVATRLTARATLRETGAPITLIGINLSRIVDGKIAEEWNTWEQLQPAHAIPTW